MQPIVNALKTLQRMAVAGTPTVTTAAPTTTAASVLAASSTRKEALIYNNGAVTVYLGTSAGVTVANGFPVPPGAVLEDNRHVGAWFGVTASGTGDLRIVSVV